ncbi:hypothetical protein ACJX0J_018504, partial [Zea mays]
MEFYNIISCLQYLFQTKVGLLRKNGVGMLDFKHNDTCHMFIIFLINDGQNEGATSNMHNQGDNDVCIVPTGHAILMHILGSER